MGLRVFPANDGGHVGERGDEGHTVGHLGHAAAAGKLIQRRPAIWQTDSDGNKRSVSGRYVLRPGDEIGFEVDDCDAAESEAAEVGIEPWMRGRKGTASGFTYFTTPRAGVTLEVRQSPRA